MKKIINREIFNDFNTIAKSFLWVLKWILTPLAHILPYIYAANPNHLDTMRCHVIHILIISFT